MSKLYDFKIQGQTALDVAINTVAVEYHGDGSLRFTLATGEKVWYVPEDSGAAKLFKAIFTGTGGLASGLNVIGA